MKVLVFGSNGLVGNSLRRKFKDSTEYDCFFSTRNDTDLFSLENTENVNIKDTKLIKIYFILTPFNHSYYIVLILFKPTTFN